MSEVRYPVVLTFRVDEATKKILDEASLVNGVSAATLCRELVLHGIGTTMDLPKVRGQVANRDLLRGVLGELGRQGGNLNQVARALNAGRFSAAAEDLSAMRAAYETALASITGVLGTKRNP